MLHLLSKNCKRVAVSHHVSEHPHQCLPMAIPPMTLLGLQKEECVGEQGL